MSSHTVNAVNPHAAGLGAAHVIPSRVLSLVERRGADGRMRSVLGGKETLPRQHLGEGISGTPAALAGRRSNVNEGERNALNSKHGWQSLCSCKPDISRESHTFKEREKMGRTRAQAGTSRSVRSVRNRQGCQEPSRLSWFSRRIRHLSIRVPDILDCALAERDDVHSLSIHRALRARPQAGLSRSVESGGSP